MCVCVCVCVCVFVRGVARRGVSTLCTELGVSMEREVCR